MNQAWLSRIPLASLTIAYAQQENYSPAAAFLDITRQLCGKELAHFLTEDIGALQDCGLKNLSAQEHHRLHARYSSFSESPYAQEIVAWLEGQYTFDPACLTE
jgi:predicted NodU family carbamoyl transferase